MMLKCLGGQKYFATLSVGDFKNGSEWYRFPINICHNDQFMLV